MSINNRTVIVITGPTASGKTALGVSLALALGTEVVSADSMQLYRGSQPTPVTFFRRFDLCGKIILLSLVIYLCTYLWSLLFVIPGVIAWYRYRMSRYVLLDHPDMGVLTAWAHSKRMMQGRKAQLFLLDLLYVEYFKRTRETSMANRTATADAVSDKLY